MISTRKRKLETNIIDKDINDTRNEISEIESSITSFERSREYRNYLILKKDLIKTKKRLDKLLIFKHKADIIAKLARKCDTDKRYRIMKVDQYLSNINPNKITGPHDLFPEEIYYLLCVIDGEFLEGRSIQGPRYAITGSLPTELIEALKEVDIRELGPGIFAKGRPIFRGN